MLPAAGGGRPAIRRTDVASHIPRPPTNFGAFTLCHTHLAADN